MQLKTCSICKEEKTLDQFSKHSGCKFGVRPQCRKCHSLQSIRWQQQNKQHRKEYLKKWYENNPDKVLANREAYKPTKNSLRRKKYAECQETRIKAIKKSKEWQESNPQKRKAQRLKTYGLSYEDYIKMLDDCDNKCQICGFSETSDKKMFPLVDHCHSTGKVRGILCCNCNQALGKFKDNVDFLKKAIEYLRKTMQ